MRRTLFAIELAIRLDMQVPGRSVHALCGELRELARARDMSRQEALGFWQHLSALLLRELPYCSRGIWDYSNDDAEAGRMFADYASTLKTKKGARTSPSVYAGQGPMRGGYVGEQHCNVTFAWLIASGSETARGLAMSCAVREDALWHRQTFAHLLRNMGHVNTGDLKSSVFYTIPGDPEYALTNEDLSSQDFSYLRSIAG